MRIGVLTNFKAICAGVGRRSGRNPWSPIPHRRDGTGFKVMRNALSRILVPLVLLASGTAMSHDELSVDQLKAKVSSASVSDKVHICVQIAEKQLDAANKLYESGEIAEAQPALTDVVAFSELARDYSIQSKKHQKQTEISVRTMTRKLTAILHLLGREDQPPVQDAITRLDRVRDDLLSSMFTKGAK